MSVDLTVKDSLAELVLNRPERLNAVDEAMARELGDCLDRAENQNVRALLIRGAGAAFCARRDLGEAQPAGEDAEGFLNEILNPLIKRIATFPAPSFAAVHGSCLGPGMGLALACDVVYVADDAQIGWAPAQTGAVPDSGAHSFLVSRLGAHRALELIYTARLLSGAEAAAMGLVNRSMPKEKLLDHARSVAAQVARGPTAALRESKHLVRRIDEEALGLFAVLRCEAQAQGAISRTEDYKEGMRALGQKRAPAFTGR